MDITDNLTSQAFPQVPHNWSLANDAKLSNLLQRLSEKLTLKTHDVQTALDKLENKIDIVGVDVCNTNNDLFILSHKQFMENRTYISANISLPGYPLATTKVSMTMANETGIFTACKSALFSGIAISKRAISPTAVDESDNIFTSRALPPIIGSDDFLLQSNYCTPSNNLVTKNHSEQSMDPKQSPPVTQSIVTASICTSVSSITEPSNSSSLCQVNSNLDSRHSSEDIQEQFVKVDNVKTDENQPVFKGIPVLPLQHDQNTTKEDLNEIQNNQIVKASSSSNLPATSRNSNRVSYLFDSDSDTDGLFEIRPKQSSVTKSFVSTGSNEREDPPVKKVPTGGVSIFPSALTNTIQKKPPIKAKPLVVKPSKESTGLNSDLVGTYTNKVDNKVIKNYSSDDSCPELFAPVVEKDKFRKRKPKEVPVLNSSFEEDSSLPVKRNFSKVNQSNVIAPKRKHIMPSKEKNLFSSDDSDSDPFSCTMNTSPPHSQKHKVVQKVASIDKSSPVLFKETIKPNDQSIYTNSGVSNVITENNCDIFSNSINALSRHDSNNSSLKPDERVSKLPRQIPIWNESEDEDIFKNDLSLPCPNLESAPQDYNHYVTPDDSTVPSLPSRPLSSSDLFDDPIFSPPPMDQVVVPVYTSISRQFLESPTHVGHSSSFFRDSPPPLSTAVDSTSVSGRIVQTVSQETCNSESSHCLTPKDQSLPGCEKAIEANLAKFSTLEYNTELENTGKNYSKESKTVDSLISSLQSRLSFGLPNETGLKNPIVTGSQPSLDLSSQHRDNEEQSVFEIPPMPPTLINIQKGRPKIQQKRRLPTKKKLLLNISNDNKDVLESSKRPSNTQVEHHTIEATVNKRAENPDFKDPHKPSKLHDLSSVQISKNTTLSGSNSSVDDIFSSNFEKLENEETLAKNISQSNNTERKLKSHTEPSKLGAMHVETINTDSLPNAMPKSTNYSSNQKNSSKLASIFGTDSSDEDELFSSSYSKLNFEQNVKNSRSIDNRKAGNLNVNSNVTAKFNPPLETSKDSFISKEKDNISDKLSIDRGSGAQPSKIQEEEFSPRSISNDVDSSILVKKSKNKDDNFFDISSDEDSLFNTKPNKPKNSKTTSDKKQKSDSTKADSPMTKEKRTLGETVASNIVAKSTLFSESLGDASVVKEEQSSGENKIHEILPQKLSNSNVSDVHALRLDKENKSKMANSCGEQSSDNNDIFYSMQSENNKAENISNCTINRSANINKPAYNNKKLNITVNPLFTVDNENPTEVHENFNKNSHKKSLIITGNLTKPSSKALNSSVSVKKEQISNNIDLFDSDSSDGDGLFSFTSGLSKRQKSTGNTNVKVVGQLNQPILKSTNTFDQTQKRLSNATSSPCSDTSTGTTKVIGATLPAGNAPNRNVDRKSEKVERKNMLNFSDDSKDLPLEKKHRLKQATNRLNPVKKTSIFSDSSDDSDGMFSSATKRISPISEKSNLQINTASRKISPVLQKSYQTAKTFISCSDDDDELFSCQVQPKLTKSVSAHSTQKSLFPTDDDDDDLFRSAKR